MNAGTAFTVTEGSSGLRVDKLREKLTSAVLSSATCR